MTTASTTLEQPVASGDSPPLLARLHRYLEIYCIVLVLVQVIWLDLHGNNTLIALGPVNLQAVDLLTPAIPVLLVFLVIRRIRPPVATLFFLVVYGFSLARGISSFGGGALPALRVDIGFIALMVIASTWGVDRIGYRTIERMFIGAGCVVAAISLSRFAFGPNFLIDRSNLAIEIVDDWNDGRTIGGPAIVLLTVALLLSIGREFALRLPNPRPRFTPLTLALIAVVIASGQRTASLGFVVAMLLILANRVRLVVVLLLMLVPIAGIVAMTGVIDLGLSTFEEVGQGMGGRSGTFAYRIKIWDAFLDSLSRWSGTDLFFGRPIGPRPPIYLLGREWTSSLHSAYLGFIPLIGLFGTVVFLLLVVGYVLRAAGYYALHRPAANAAAVELRVWTAMILLIYGVSYEWRDTLGLAAGLVFCSMLAPPVARAGAALRQAARPALADERRVSA